MGTIKNILIGGASFLIVATASLMLTNYLTKGISVISVISAIVGFLVLSPSWLHYNKAITNALARKTKENLEK